MNTNSRNQHSNVKEAAARLALTLTLAVCVTGQMIAIAPSANAQGLDAGQMGSLSQLNGLSPDSESLLPPEVVPLDPDAASRLVESQAATRQMSSFNQDSDAGSNELQFSSGTQGARDNRQQAFQSLMGKEDLWQNASDHYKQAQQQLQAQAGYNQALNQPAPGMVQPGSAPGMAQPGFAPGMAQPGFAPGMAQPQTANQGQQPGYGLTPMMMPGQGQQIASNMPAQTQTLSGGVKRSPVKGLIRSGFSHTVTSLAAFGAGAYTATAARSSPMALYSLGIMGVGLGNYALRSGFRF